MYLFWCASLLLITRKCSCSKEQSAATRAAAVKDHLCLNWRHARPCLKFHKADVVHITSKGSNNIWYGECLGSSGYFDSSCVGPELQRLEDTQTTGNYGRSLEDSPKSGGNAQPSWSSRLKQIYLQHTRTSPSSSLIFPTVFYTISLAVLFHAYSRKRMLDDYEAALRSRQKRLEQDLAHDDQASTIESLRAELEAAALSEKMCTGKLREYEALLKEKEAEVEKNELRLQDLSDELGQLRSKLVDYEEESVKMSEKSEMSEYQRMRETDILKQRIDESNRSREELEAKVTKLSVRLETLQPLLEETGSLLDQMDKFSFTRIDSLLLDPLDTEFSDFIKKFDDFKSRHRVESFKQAVQDAKVEAEINTRNTKAQLREKDEQLQEACDRLAYEEKQLEVLKVKLETIEDLRQKDMANSTREISDLRQQLETTLCENKKLTESSSEASSLWHKVSILKEENESLRNEFARLSEENKELSTSLERKCAEFSLERDNLLSLNESLRRKVIEKEHSLVRMSSPATQESRRSTPNSLPAQLSPSLGIGAPPSNPSTWSSANGGVVVNSLLPPVVTSAYSPDHRSASVPPPNGTSPTLSDSLRYPVSAQHPLSPQDMLRAQLMYQMHQQRAAAWYQDPRLQRPIPNRLVAPGMWQPFMWPRPVHPEEEEEDDDEDESSEDEQG